MQKEEGFPNGYQLKFLQVVNSCQNLKTLVRRFTSILNFYMILQKQCQLFALYKTLKKYIHQFTLQHLLQREKTTKNIDAYLQQFKLKSRNTG